MKFSKPDVQRGVDDVLTLSPLRKAIRAIMKPDNQTMPLSPLDKVVIVVAGIAITLASILVWAGSGPVV